MPRATTYSATVPAQSRATEDAAAPTTRGQKLILWGWLTTMLGVGLYCKAVFTLGPDADLIQALTRTGVPGHAAAILLPAGILLWFAGTFLYMYEAVRGHTH
jgi:hypothetical protein